jgi:hypothetical protein
VLKGKGVDPDQEVAHNSRVRIETPIEKRLDTWNFVLFGSFIVLFYVFPFRTVYLPHRVRQLSKVLFSGEKLQVELVSEVCDSPRKDVVLRKVVEASSCDVVDIHQVAVVADLAGSPLRAQKLHFFRNGVPPDDSDMLSEQNETGLPMILFEEGKEIASILSDYLQSDVQEEIAFDNSDASMREFFLYFIVLEDALIFVASFELSRKDLGV